MVTKRRVNDPVLAHGDPELTSPQQAGHMVVLNATREVEAEPATELETKPTTAEGTVSDIDELEQDDIQADIRRVLSELDEDAGRASIRLSFSLTITGAEFSTSRFTFPSMTKTRFSKASKWFATSASRLKVCRAFRNGNRTNPFPMCQTRVTCFNSARL